LAILSWNMRLCQAATMPVVLIIVMRFHLR
jgi:hypothetical protein